MAPDGTEEKQESPEVSQSDEVENLAKLDPIEEDAAAASKEQSADYNNQSILDDTQDDIESGDPLENLENHAKYRKYRSRCFRGCRGAAFV
jgi:hypothetical protein